MKSKFFISVFIFNLMAISLFSQEIKINIETPLVRQYNNIWVAIDFIFFKNYLANQLNKSFEKPDNGSMNMQFFPKDTGEIQIGPLEFVFDSIKYHSNIAKIKVLPPLEPKIGIYINSYYFDRKNFVLIEQIYEKKDLNNESSSTLYYSNTSDSYKDSLAYLDFSCNNKIKITHSQTIHRNLWIKSSTNKNGSLYYSTKFFEIVNNSGRKIILTRNFYKNLPAEYILHRVEMR
jgi:hypothetical protein